MLIKDKDIIPIVVNKIRSCACKLKYLILWLEHLEFCFTFWKIWVGKAMGNETFYWDGFGQKKMIDLAQFTN